MRSMSTDNVSYSGVNWRKLAILIPYFTEFKLRISLALLCLVFAKFASIYAPFILKDIIDYFDSTNTEKLALILPLGLLIGYGLARFCNTFFSELRDTLFGRVTERAMRRIGLTVFKKLHSFEYAFHLDRKTGGVSRDMERGVSGISFIMRFMIFNIIPTILEIILVMVLLGKQYSIWFSVIVFCSVIFYILFSVFATEFRTRFVRKMNQAESQSSTQVVDSLINYETVKYFSNEDYEFSRYDKHLAVWEKARQKNRLTLFLLNGGQSFIIAFFMTFSLILAGHFYISGTMTLGDFVLINTFMIQIFLPLNFLGFVYRELKGSMANIEKMIDILDRKSTIIDNINAQDISNIKGEINFSNVTFGYNDTHKTITDLSLCITPKSKVAIVGSSGAGKSTIFKLLMRFYDLQSGSISIDGLPIDQVTQHSLRKNISVVPQDCVLFNTTLRENIRYGRIVASDTELTTAIDQANLTYFVESLPKGLDTVVGERGLKLSGGEKQRVAIARAILKNAPILIFDEATSALDSISEKAILKAMKNIGHNQTTLVIAHRLSTIVDADTIFVMDKGQLVEQGSHSELIAKNGVYASMWKIQLNQLT